MLQNDAHADGSPLAEEIQIGILNALEDGICFVAMNGVIRFWNTAAESITGISKTEAISARGVNNLLVCCDAHGENRQHPPPSAVASQEINEFDSLFLRHKEGHQIPVRIRWIPVRAEDSRLIGAAALFRAGEQALRDDALDLGTLDARSPGGTEDEESDFLAELERRLRHRNGLPAGVLLAAIDLVHDHEKMLGREMVVRLSQMVARTVGLCLEPGDSAGTWEDYSVLALLNTADHEQLAGLAERIRRLAHASGVSWWGETVKITLTLVATLTSPSDTPDSVLRRLKESGEKAQAQGGNRVVLV